MIIRKLTFEFKSNIFCDVEISVPVFELKPKSA